VAQKIQIDIVADTKKLTDGVNEANNQVNNLSTGLKGAASAATAAASAFVLKQGVSFLKDGIDEAKEAKQVMTEATTTFGAGSEALAKITADAEKFGKAMAVDNDEIIKLSVQLGARLPEDAKALSAELVNLGFDVEAFTGGAISAETMTGKLAKALADGELKATDLQKIVPGLTEAQYAQAEAASKAGDNQKALDIIIDAAQAKYGDAAEKNVTSTQKFETALANLKESVGTKILPIVEKFINALTTLIEKFDGLPTPVQNLILGLTGVVAIGGPLLTFLASAKTALVTLGIVKGTTTAATGAYTAATGAQTAATGLATAATSLLTIAMYALPIMAVVGLIILLVKNWDDVTDAVKKVWKGFTEWLPKAWDKAKEFAGKVIDFAKDIVEAYLALPSKMFNIGKNILEGLWNGMKNMVGWLKNKVVDLFEDILPSWAKKALGIKSPSRVFAGIGKNIADGLWTGLNKNQYSLKRDITEYFGDLVPEWAKSALGIQSPSRVFAGIGQNVVEGFATGLSRGIPLLSADNAATSNIVNVTINAGAGTDAYALGRTVQAALNKYSTVSNRVGTLVTL
jgi:hypothetical protein